MLHWFWINSSPVFNMAVTTANPAPYAPPSAILDVIDRFRNRGLQTPFTAEVLTRAGVSDSLVPRTLQALQTLELIGPDGAPTETLEQLRRAKEADLQGQLAAWIQSVYADVLSFVEPGGDETDIRDAFRSYNPVGQQPRMVALFMGLCRAAGLRSSEQTRESRPRPAARKQAAASAAGTRRDKAPPPQAKAPHTTMPGGMPPALSGLLNSLPLESGQWTTAEREKFVRTFEAVLDFCFAINNAPPPAATDDDEE